MKISPQNLAEKISAALGERVSRVSVALDEVTVECKPSVLVEVATQLRDNPALRFEQLIDLCGIDYSEYGDGTWQGARFAVVYHLLSITHNERLRLRAFASDGDFPVLATVIPVWPAANWFEREAFDLFGIMFDGHPDLRRILTDYGFVGHPFRKDFPMIGNVEMRYDEAQKRVVYQPVTIDQRNNVPRVIRDEGAHAG